MDETTARRIGGQRGWDSFRSTLEALRSGVQFGGEYSDHKIRVGDSVKHKLQFNPRTPEDMAWGWHDTLRWCHENAWKIPRTVRAMEWRDPEPFGEFPAGTAEFCAVWEPLEPEMESLARTICDEVGRAPGEAETRDLVARLIQTEVLRWIEKDRASRVPRTGP